jgi:heme-degrading monooxygenase HmoA
MEFVGIAKFKIKSEFTDAQMLEAEKGIQEAMKTQKGFLSRNLGKFEDGFWIVTIKWDSKENGSKWTENSKQFEAVQKQHEMLDFSTMRMEFYQNQIIN